MTFHGSRSLMSRPGFGRGRNVGAQHSDPEPVRQPFPRPFAGGQGGRMSAPSPWWDRHVHEDRRPILAVRGRIKAAARDFFTTRGFIEVESAALQVSPGNEAHLHAFSTELHAPDGAASRLYLHTSPEFACKKLIAAGERRIFDFARVFRNRERGALHHPAFA